MAAITTTVRGAPILALQPPKDSGTTAASFIARQAGFVYVLTGVAQVLLVQLLRDAGAAVPASLLTVCLSYLGMMLVGLRGGSAGRSLFVVPGLPQGRLALISLLDVAAFALNTTALMLAGATAYQLAHSSQVVFTAVLSLVCLGRRLSRVQYAAVAAITAGLALVSLQRDVGDVGHSDASAASRTLGTLLAVAGTATSALLYVLSERLLRGYDVAPDSMCAVVGAYGFGASSLYVLLFTLPRWQTLVVDPMHARSGSALVAVLGYAGLVAAAYLHNLAYFYQLGQSGSTTTGVLQAGRAALVIVCSAVFFCHTDAAQCLTWPRTMAVAVVCMAMIAYAAGAAQSATTKRRPAADV